MESAPRQPERKPGPEAAQDLTAMSRRAFLGGAAAMAASAGVERGNTHTVEAEASYEPAAEQFNHAIALEIVRTAGIQKDEVGFVLDDGPELVQAVPFRKHEVPRETVNEQGEVESSLYALTPGAGWETGIVPDGITGEWRDYERAVLEEETGYDVVGELHVQAEFGAALRKTDEPDLIAGIENGDITRLIDVVHYFGDKPVRGHPDSTRIAYVHDAIQFPAWDPEARSGLPEGVATELRRVIPGLCSYESRFDASVTSGDGAKGIFQFMDDTWAAYDGEPGEQTSLERQTEIAGRFFGDLYEQLMHHAGADALATLQAQFPSEASFARDFMVPCLLSAYNAGAARVGEGVARFAAEELQPDTPVGPDLFVEVAEFMATDETGRLGRYKSEAKGYVPGVYAHAAALGYASSAPVALQA